MVKRERSESSFSAESLPKHRQKACKTMRFTGLLLFGNIITETFKINFQTDFASEILFNHFRNDYWLLLVLQNFHKTLHFIVRYLRNISRKLNNIEQLIHT